MSHTATDSGRQELFGACMLANTLSWKCERLHRLSCIDTAALRIVTDEGQQNRVPAETTELADTGFVTPPSTESRRSSLTVTKPNRD